MMTPYILIVLLLPLAASQCPKTVDINPCKCIEMSGQRRLSCWGNISLPRLTSILRKDMCGKNIDKFELLGFDITYLPSNLFSKMTVEDIVVYAGNISRFTEGGRSAFYGLEDTLKSLSMRRCRLQDHLQWHLLGDMHSLSYLDLSYNELKSIPVQWSSRPPPNIRSLILKGNKISVLQPGALKHLYTLVELDLSENNILYYIRSALPRSANSLVILRLSYNNLDNMPKDSFDEMHGLRRIYLDHNNISTLQETTWRPVWGDLEVLDLSDNEIICDSNLHWIRKLRLPVRLYGECAISNKDGIFINRRSLDYL